MSVKELKDNEYTVLFYKEVRIKDYKYLLTLRQTQDSSFISDESVLDLWLRTLDEISWVNPNMDFKYALEVYDRKDGYFTSIAPVILCNNEGLVTKKNVEKLFKDLSVPIEKELVLSNEYTKEFGRVLRENGFDKQFIGGGCSIKI